MVLAHLKQLVENPIVCKLYVDPRRVEFILLQNTNYT